jgi:hypothetical protein
MKAYPINSLVQMSTQFNALNADGSVGTPVDPSTVTLELTPPNGAPQQVISAGIVRTGVGAYYYQMVVSTLGLWIYRFQGEGAVIAASPNGFFQGV